MKTIKILGFAFVLFQMGCSSKEVKTADGNTIRPDVILSRIDSLSSRPDWLKESEPFKINDNELVSLGSTVIPGDDRVEAAYRIARFSVFYIFLIVIFY